MKRVFLVAALSGLIFATGALSSDAEARTRSSNGTEAAAGSSQRSQSTRNRSTTNGQKANRNQRTSSNKANRNRSRQSRSSTPS